MQYITIENQREYSNTPPKYDNAMTIYFKDPSNPSSKGANKDLFPKYAYYDPDNPVIDLTQLPIPFGDTFTIFLPKSYNLNKWTYDKLINLKKKLILRI